MTTKEVPIEIYPPYTHMCHGQKNGIVVTVVTPEMLGRVIRLPWQRFLFRESMAASFDHG